MVGRHNKQKRKQNGNKKRHVQHIPKLETQEDVESWIERRNRRWGEKGTMNIISNKPDDIENSNNPALQREYRRGEIWFANLGTHPGSSIQNGIRPVLIISNDSNNQHSRTLTVIPMTTKIKRMYLATHVLYVPDTDSPIERISVFLAEQITTMDKSFMRGFVGKLDLKSLERVENAVMVQLGMDWIEQKKEKHNAADESSQEEQTALQKYCP